MSSEYESEPVPGLPENLPAGEVMIWQGAPDGKTVTARALHGRTIALYFGLLAAGSSVSALMNGMGTPGAISSALRFVIVGAAALGIVRLVGWLVERTTLYTITNKRIVMRFGMALPMTLNIPFTQIASADAKLFANGSGDISLTPAGSLPLTYFHLWPHGRGLLARKPKPTLRAVPNAAAVCDQLVKAIVAHGVKGEVRALVPQTQTTGITVAGSPIPAAA